VLGELGVFSTFIPATGAVDASRVTALVAALYKRHETLNLSAEHFQPIAAKP